MASNTPSESQSPSLKGIILAQPSARTFGSGVRFSLPLGAEWRDHSVEIPASRPLAPGEILDAWVSPAWRASDVPLTFHSNSDMLSTRNMMSMMDWLNEESVILQYLFDDGLVLTAGELLRHPLGRTIPRLLLPLSLQTRTELETVSFAHRPSGIRPQWLIHSDQTVASVLMAAERVNKGLFAEEAPPITLYFTLSSERNEPRQALIIEGVEVDKAGIEAADVGGVLWKVISEEADDHAYRGVVHLEAATQSKIEAAETYRLDAKSHRLIFHTWRDRLDGVRAFLSSNLGPEASQVGSKLEIKGHGQIQALIEEIEQQSKAKAKASPDSEGIDRIVVEPRSVKIGPDDFDTQLSVTSDGSFRIRFSLGSKLDGRELEAHGLPQALHYVIHLLQSGLGATTGLANVQLAHGRRGPKRERDLKLLRHVGFATLLFYECVSFALRLPSSDGDIVETLNEVKARLFRKFASFLSKGDSWNPAESTEPTVTLDTLLSEGIVSLLEGLMRQIVEDTKEKRETRLFLPTGEVRVRGLSESVMTLFRAMLADLGRETEGACFTKVRGTWFEAFTNNREGFNREDLVVREVVTPEIDHARVYTPGINERFVIPTAKLPPRGAHFLALAHTGFDLTIDGKSVELVKEGEFRPEFTLKEEFSDSRLESLPLGNRKIDWFELHPRFFFRGKELSPDEAIRLSREGIIEHEGRFFLLEPKELPNLKRLTRFWESLHGDGQGLLAGKKRRKTEDTFFQLPRSRSLELLALRASGVEIQGGPKWQAICEFYDSLDKDRGPLELPESFKATLQPYQETGVQWLMDIRRLGLGGILADDMGLGKTVTSLAFLEKLRAKEELGPTLVLVPTSLTYNWVSEMGKFTPEMKSHLFSSREPESMLDFTKARDPGIVICTYGLLQENVEIFEQVPWDVVIFDEAQALKTITTKRTTAARKIDARFKLCLTGTPLENHYGEFYSLFDLCVSGALGELPAFRERFVNPVRVLREDLDELKMKTKPLLLRRTKSQVMHQLPEKTESTLRLPFDEEQKRIYRDIATSYNRQIRDQIAKEGEAKTQLQMLTALLRLRQVCSDPRGVPGVEYKGEPPKITTLVEAISQITSEGSSALVFTQFLATFERIRSALATANIPFFEMSGADSRAERERKLRGFDEYQGGAVMLMTLKTGGVGLNLVKASYIFHIEPWWNPAVENQATDRAHRIGQTKAVQVYRYIIRDSVEEKIEVLKELKSRRFDALFGEPGSTAVETAADMSASGTSRLSQKDFEFLLS
ncbi:hypothetical protein BH10BDE1_BH10BDE1_03910 [soil metagenome]